MTTLKTIFIRLLILIIATVFLVWLIDTTKILTNHTGTPNYEAITGILKVIQMMLPAILGGGTY
ncbi:hypothetical protein [uncultured Phascolarctobacterium sp.]|jgi:hypothetical protein|uniref:hypothetical protein n=1 Tax=uncultured Phascolarctobacterium sp. TaxID=512296 RepID=UPI0025DB1BC7|nr:hypothetical protein [uncultured Phascolarctobacterium sp.]